MKDLYLVINTCKNYFSNISKLIHQLEIIKFPKNNILIVSGQEDDQSISYYLGIKLIKVKYTGIHLTGMIYVNENINLYKHVKYWMFLPDTIKFGNNFLNKLKIYYNMYLRQNNIYVLSFINPILRPTMDIGIVNNIHILLMTKYLKYIKTYNIKIENLVKLKKQLIYDENTILGLKPHNKNKSILNTENLYIKNLYITYNYKNLIRFVSNKKSDLKQQIITNNIKEVYFVLLDLYKYQRNFNGSNKKIVLTL